jgi:hypothetical protein
MPTTRKSKPTSHKRISQPKPVETDIEMDIDEEEDYEEPRRAVAARPPYLMVILLMAISFFAGYLLFKVLSLQQKLDTVATNPTAAGEQQVQAPRDVKAKKPTTSEHWKGSNSARYVWINYSDYETNKGVKFSTNRSISVTEKTKLDVKLNFKQYAFNETLSYPFSVPKNYKRKH